MRWGEAGNSRSVTCAAGAVSGQETGGLLKSLFASPWSGLSKRQCQPFPRSAAVRSGF